MFTPHEPFRLSQLKSRAITRENPTGGKGIACKGRGNGNGRKGCPCFRDIKPGESRVLADIDGPGMIRHFWFTLDMLNKREPERIRNYILRMYWDDAEYPSVEAPVPDFFGIAHGRSAPFMTPMIGTPDAKGFNCYFPMPFAKRARIEFINESDDEINFLFYQVDYTLGDQIDEDVGYFHAHFRRQNPCPLGEDFTLLNTAGSPGVFIGTNIGVIPHARGWWGEGEIKFYIDGDKVYPTICGTGTEDYPCCGWGFSPHDAIYTGVNYRQLNNTDPDSWNEIISFYRLHLMDPIFFQNDLRVELQQIGAGGVMPTEITDMEAQRQYLEENGFRGPHIHPDSDRPGELMSNWLYDRSDDYCATVYWYQRLTGTPLPPIPNKEERIKDIAVQPWEDDPMAQKHHNRRY